MRSPCLSNVVVRQYVCCPTLTQSSGLKLLCEGRLNIPHPLNKTNPSPPPYYSPFHSKSPTSFPSFLTANAQESHLNHPSPFLAFALLFASDGVETFTSTAGNETAGGVADENRFLFFLVKQILEICLHPGHVVRQSGEGKLGSAYGGQLVEGDGVTCFFGGFDEGCPGGPWGVSRRRGRCRLLVWLRTCTQDEQTGQGQARKV